MTLHVKALFLPFWILDNLILVFSKASTSEMDSQWKQRGGILVQISAQVVLEVMKQKGLSPSKTMPPHTPSHDDSQRSQQHLDIHMEMRSRSRDHKASRRQAP